MYRSPNIVRMIKSRILRWAGHVARMEECGSAFEVLTGKINLPLFSTVVPSNILDILDGTTVENKGKLILTEIFPSVQKHDIF